jgi:hypothetical protein
MSSNTPTVIVVHGTDRKRYALVGKTVKQAIEMLDGEVYNGLLSGLSWLVNGTGLRDLLGGEGYILQMDDELSFLGRGGDKG